MMKLGFAAAALAGLMASVTPAPAEEARMQRTISISGHGETRSVPDTAFVTSGVMSQAATAAEALAANTTAMNALFAALKQAGIAERDVQTSNFSIQPRLDFGNNNTGQPPKLVGYDVSNTVTVRVRKIADLGPLLDRLVQSGSNQVNGISFQVSEPEAALDAARKLAAEDATRKAKVYAGAMGVSLGPVLSISEGGGYQPPVPMFRSAMMKSDEAAGAPVPVAAGEQTMAVDVNIVWEIK